jgi:hypothetical protein
MNANQSIDYRSMWYHTLTISLFSLPNSVTVVKVTGEVLARSKLHFMNYLLPVISVV